MSFEEKELGYLEAHLHDVYRELEQVSGATSKLTPAMLSSARSYMVASGEAKKLAEQYEKARIGMQHVIDAAMRGERVSLSLTRGLSKNAESIRNLTEQYKKLEAVQKYVEFNMKSFSQKTQTVVQTLGNWSSGVTNLTTKLGGLNLAHSQLTETLLKYNSTQFESMRIGERYGDSMESHAKALDIISKRTAFSRQEFEDLNSTIKQMTVGLPMTSKAVADLAANFSGKFGYSAERVKKAITDLIPLQNKLPDLFGRISKVSNDFSTSLDKGAKSAHELRNQLRAIGASQNEIETTMSAVRGATPDTQAWLKFEETIAKSKRDIADSNLEISSKMQPGLEAVAKAQALFAKGVASMPALLMLGVGGFSMMGAAAASLLGTVLAITANIKTWSGLAGTQIFGKNYVGDKGAGSGQSGGAVNAAGGAGARSRVNGRVLGIASVGGIVGNMAGSYLENNWANNYQAQSDSDKTLSTRKGLSRALSYGSTGAALGASIGSAVPIIGTAVGAAVGGLGGAALGGFMGWKEGQAGTKDQMDAKKQQQAMKGSMMGATAQAMGVKVYDDSSQEAVLEAVKKEKDEHVKKRVLQEMYATGLIDEKKLEETIYSEVKDINKAKKETDQIVKDTHSSIKSILDVEMQIERVAGAQTKALQTQLNVINQIKESGKSAVSGLLTGDSALVWANILGDNGVASAKEAAKNAKQQFVTTFTQFNADNPELQKSLGSQNFMGLQAMADANKKLKVLDDQKVALIRAQETKNKTVKEDDPDRIKKLQDIENEYKPQLAPILESIANINAELTKTGESLDWSAMFKVSEDSFKKASAEYKQMQESGTATPKQMADQYNRIEQAQSKMIDYLRMSGEAERQAFEKAEGPSRLKIQLLQSQKEIGSLLISQAEKLGMPQSYKAIQDQMRLIQQERNELVKMQQAQDAVIKGFEIQGVDVNAVVNNQVSVEEALAKAGLASAENEQKFTNALMRRQEVTKQLTANTNELYDITKVWREGWMDAMNEFAIGAGDFTATIGVGDQNVTEKLAAGGLDTSRYGGTNRQDLNMNQMLDVRYGQASRFTPTFGQTGGNAFQDPNPLMKYTGVLAELGNPERNAAEADRIAKAGIAQVNINGGSDAIMGQAMAQVEKAINGGDLQTAIKELTAAFKARSVSEEYEKGIKQPGVHQPKSGGGLVRMARGGSLCGSSSFGGTRIKKFGLGGPASFEDFASDHGYSGESFKNFKQNIYDHLYKKDPKIKLKPVAENLRSYSPFNDPSSGSFAPKYTEKAKIGVKPVAPKTGFYNPAADPTMPGYRGAESAAKGAKSAAKGAKSAAKLAGTTGVLSSATNMYLLEQIGEGVSVLNQRATGDDTRSQRKLEEYESKTTKLGQFAWVVKNIPLAVDIASQQFYGGEYQSISETKRTAELDERVKQLRVREIEVKKNKAAREKVLEEGQKRFRLQNEREIATQELKKKYNVPKTAALAGIQGEQLQKRVEQAASKTLYDPDYQKMLREQGDAEVVSYSTAVNDNKNLLSRFYFKTALTPADENAKNRIEHDLNMAKIHLESRLANIEIKKFTKERNQKRSEIENKGVEIFKQRNADKLKNMVGTYTNEFGQYSVRRGKDGKPVVTMTGGPAYSAEASEEAKEFKKQFDSLKSPNFEIEAKKNAAADDSSHGINQNTQQVSGVFRDNVRVATKAEAGPGIFKNGERYNIVPKTGSGVFVNGNKKFADGGMIEPGSYVVKTSEAQANAGALNSMGASWVTGGIPGQDSVMFGVGMAAGGNASHGSALLMPGEAIVPPAYADIGAAINSGLSLFADGGNIPDGTARQDILSSSSKAMQPQPIVASGGMTLELSDAALEFFRPPQNNFSNGSR